MKYYSSNNKILLVVTEYSGGMRPYALNIINCIKDDNLYVFVVIRNNEDKKDFKDFPSERLIFVKYPSKKILRFLFKIFPITLLLKLFFTTKSLKIKVIHFLTSEPCLGFYAPILKSFYTIIYTVHDAIPHSVKYKNIKHFLTSKFLIWIPIKISMNTYSHLTTNSRTQYDYLKNKYKNKNIYFHNFPTLITPEIEQGNINISELHGINSYILYFGTISYYKGIDLLYSLYLKYAELHQYPLVIAGSGHIYFPKIDKNTNVIWINRFLNDNELQCLFSKAECVVYPYREATQSGVISLSSFFGKKTIISNIDYFKELSIKNEAIIYTDINNEAHFLSDLKNILNKKRVNSYNEYIRLYSSETLQNQIKNIYKEILFQ